MAFQKKTWKDRITEFPTRRTLTKSDGSTELVTVARAEGTVSQEGDAFNAASMNDLEERISQANNDLNNSLTANNTRFVFDYQDGKYGFNTDPNRGADTFFPFSSGAKAELLWENIADTSKDFIATTVIIESTYTIATGYFKTRGAGCFYEAGGSSATRNIIVTSNKSIQFDAGYIDRNKNNNYMIPAKIYGVNVL